jgi:hypothetical protein
MFTINFAPETSWVDNYLPTITTAVVSVVAILVTHFLSRTGERAIHRRERAERLFAESRRLIGDLSLEATKYLEVAAGRITVAGALEELRSKNDAIYGVGSDARPFSKCEMLIGLYFPQASDWFAQVNVIQLKVTSTMQEFNHKHGGNAHKCDATIQTLLSLMDAYTAQAQSIGPMLKEEVDRLDHPFLSRLPRPLRSLILPAS